MESTVPYVVQTTAATAKSLKRYDDNGGILEFVFLDVTEDSGPPEELHRKAALKVLEEIRRRIDLWAKSVVQKHGGALDDLFRVVIPEGFSPDGHQISIVEFLGPLYDNADGFRRRSNSGLSDDMGGFAYAFMKPPHLLKESESLFVEFKDLIFDGFPECAEVWEWETDGLNYFDAGREWWGTFYWTYRAATETPIIGILGSTTD